MTRNGEMGGRGESPGRRVRHVRPRRIAVAHSSRSRLSGPSIPFEAAEALFAALRAHYQGDEEAIERWDRQCNSKWLRILTRWAPTWVNVEDLLQDLKVTACAAVKASSPVRSPGGWLSRVALHRVQRLIRLRAKEKEKEKEKETETETEKAVPDSHSSPAVEAMLRMEGEVLLRTLRDLPPPWGYLLYARMVLELTFGEIRVALCAGDRSPGPKVGIARLAQMVPEGREMVHAALQGTNLRKRWPGRFEPAKNRWVGRILPPIGH